MIDNNYSINYILVSNATIRNPISGIKLLHNIASKYKIPVNWIVNLRTIELYRDFFNEFHQKNNDDLIFQLQPNDPILENPGMEEKKPNFNTWNNVDDFTKLIHTQKENIIKLLPWAKLNTAYLNIYSNSYLKALKNKGFIAIYGTRWKIDNYYKKNITGLPIGTYKSSEYFYIPTKNTQFEFICFDNSTLDFNRVYHSGKSYYNFHSLYLQKKKILTKNNINYWKKLIDIYRKNTKYNKLINIIQYEPANELEFSMQNNHFRFPSEVEEVQLILDKIFQYISNQPDIITYSISNLSQIIYNNSNLDMGINYLYLDNFVIPNKEYQILIRSKKFRKQIFKEKIYYGIKKLLRKSNADDKPEIWPKNGKIFPTIFVYQDSFTQMLFYPDNPKSKLKRNVDDIIITRPFKQFFYRNNWIFKRNYFPLIKNYSIQEELNKKIINLEIQCSYDINWGVLLNQKCNSIEIIHSNNEVAKTCSNKSKKIESFIFAYLILKKGLNKYKLIIQ